jgi:hypothetical protein
LGRRGLREKFLDQRCHLLLERPVGLRVCRSGETGVDLAHVAVAAEDKGGRPAVEVLSMWDLLVQLIGSSGDEYRIGDSVALDKSA